MYPSQMPQEASQGVRHRIPGLALILSSYVTLTLDAGAQTVVLTLGALEGLQARLCREGMHLSRVGHKKW